MADSYTATRIQVMRTKLIPSADYERLMKMTEKEIIGYLQGSEYRQDVDALALKDLEDLEVIDKIIARNTDRTLEKLQKISRDDFLLALNIFLVENDIWNLKMIAESLATSTDPRLAIKRYAKRGTFDPMPLADATSITDLAKRAAPHIKSLASYPDNLPAFLDTLGEGSRIGKQVSARRYLIDEENISRLIMLKGDKMQPEQIIKRLRLGGSVPLTTLKTAANTGSVDESLKVLRRTKYSKAAELAGNSMMEFEYALHREVLKRIRRISGTYPLRPEVLVRYLIEKDIETENLRLLIKGKQLGLEEQFLRAQLIT